MLKKILKGLRARSEPPKYTNKKVLGIMPINEPTTYTRSGIGVTPNKKLTILNGKSGMSRKNKTVLSPLVSKRDTYVSILGYFEISFFALSRNIYRAKRKASADPIVLPIIATNVPIQTPNIEPLISVIGVPGKPRGEAID